MDNIHLVRSLAVSESGFLFQPTTGETFTVNDVGRVVLHELQNGKSIEDIAQIILDQYDVDGASLERDLSDFLAQLRQYQLVTENE